MSDRKVQRVRRAFRVWLVRKVLRVRRAPKGLRVRGAREEWQVHEDRKVQRGEEWGASVRA